MHKYQRGGFTLVELLVVIGIIAAILIMITPSLQKTVVKAKDQSVKSNCAAIEAGIATFAARNGGSYPALALDPIAPFPDKTQILGDPDLTGSAASQFANFGSYGITGDYGHRNASASTVSQQLDTVRNTTLTSGNINTQRYFDVLIQEDCLQEYPFNPFTGSLTSRANRMKNVFGIFTDVDALTDTTDVAQMNDLTIDLPWINCTTQGKDVSAFTGVYYSGFQSAEFAWNFGQLPLALPIDPTTFNPTQFDQLCGFGTDDGDYFAEGNFAYVPVLGSSVFPLSDDPTTIRNEKYQWGSRVTAYMMFGYGSRKNRSDLFRDEQLAYLRTGLPGYGTSGIDTRYEEVVLQLFEGAVYFNKVGL